MLADSFEVMVFWMSGEPMLRGRTYLLRAGASTVAATVAPLKYRLNLANLDHVAANQLEHREVGCVRNRTGRADCFRPLRRDQADTRGRLLDPVTQESSERD